MNVILTAAVTANGMIAHHSHEVISWSEDLKLFREQTMGQTVIMGSNTARTLAMDLDGRQAVVVDRNADPEEVLRQIKTEECYVIGGSKTYSRFAPHLTHVYLTYHPYIFSTDSLPLFSGLDRDLRLEFLNLVHVEAKKGIYQFRYEVTDR